MSYDRDAWRNEVENGKIPLSKLAEIEPAQYDPDLHNAGMLHPEAAASMSALLKEAPDELRTLYTYRTIVVQWQKWADYQNGGNLAAYPGTSNHGWAVSVDFTGLTVSSLSWLAHHAKEYGWTSDVPTENWHYTYYGGYKPLEDEMTPEERERLKNVEAWQEGYDEAVAGKPVPPSRAKPARRRGYKAGTKAMNNPKAP